MRARIHPVDTIIAAGLFAVVAACTYIGGTVALAGIAAYSLLLVHVIGVWERTRKPKGSGCRQLDAGSCSGWAMEKVCNHFCSDHSSSKGLYGYEEGDRLTPAGGGCVVCIGMKVEAQRNFLLQNRFLGFDGEGNALWEARKDSGKLLEAVDKALKEEAEHEFGR